LNEFVWHEIYHLIRCFPTSTVTRKPFEEWPPMHLVALNLNLSYWIGQSHSLNDALQMIFQAYAAGKLAFDEYQKAVKDKKKAEAAKKAKVEAAEKEKANPSANART
jgi:hypothetical protein